MNKKQKLSLLLPAIIAVLSGIIALSAVTYAWINVAVGTFTNVTPTVGGKISKGTDNLLIGTEPGGENYDVSCDLQVIYPDFLLPISTADLDHFYTSAQQDRQGVSIRFRDETETFRSFLLSGTLYLQYLGNQCDVYFSPPELDIRSTDQILSAGRLGLKITQDDGTVTRWVFTLDYFRGEEETQHRDTVEQVNSVIAGIDSSGSPRFVDDPARPIEEFFLEEPNHQKLLSMQFGQIAQVDFFLYLEGCDDACFNPMIGDDVSEEVDFTQEPVFDANNPNVLLQLGFAAEPVIPEEQ